MTAPAPHEVRPWLLGLQDRICAAFESEDGRRALPRGAASRARAAPSRGRACSRTARSSRRRRCTSPTRAARRCRPPPRARRPELAGAPFQAISVSLIAHPRNPYVPDLAHEPALLPGLARRRAAGLVVRRRLRPDAVLRLRGGLRALARGRAPRLRAARARRPTRASRRRCDEYFFLRHRGEPRGIGGLFFDDLAEAGFADGLRLRAQRGRRLPRRLPADRAAPEGRRPSASASASWQLLRRGRYVEFNLVYDRGTLYGLQSGRRIESVLASMPPLVAWRYDCAARAGLAGGGAAVERYLAPREWVR